MKKNLMKTEDISGSQNIFLKLKNDLSGSGGTILICLLSTFLLSAIIAPAITFSRFNFLLVMSYLAIPLIVGIFASFSLLVGVPDLSIGAMVALSACIFGCLTYKGMNPWISAIIAVVICIGFGALNGVAIIFFGANPIAVTLGMLIGLRGLIRIIGGYFLKPTEGNDGAVVWIPGLNNFTEKVLFDFIPVVFIIGVAVMLVAQFYVTKTGIGRHVRAIGGDALASRRAGLHVERTKFVALMLSAFGASIAGILFVGKLGAAPAALGTNMEFTVYAALMIGGYSITKGGVGNPSGAIAGILCIAFFSNLIDNKGIDVRATDIFVGVLLLTVMWLDARRTKYNFE